MYQQGDKKWDEEDKKEETSEKSAKKVTNIVITSLVENEVRKFVRRAVLWALQDEPGVIQSSVFQTQIERQDWVTNGPVLGLDRPSFTTI